LPVFESPRVRSRRSLIALSLAALAGLAVAAYGLFAVDDRSKRGVPPEAIATVNDRLILRTDHVKQTEARLEIPFAAATSEQRRRVLDEMIAEELLVQRGLAADLPLHDPEVRKALVSGVELQMFASVLAQQPSEEDLRNYYAKHKDKYVRDGRMQLRDLVVPAEVGHPRKIAKAAVVALRGGAPLQGVMQQFGLRDSGKLPDSGQDEPGWLVESSVRARLAPGLFHAASALSGGEVSEPITVADRVHIVVMYEREPPRQREFDEAANQVWADLRRDAQQAVRESHLRHLRENADVQIADAR